MNRESFFVLFLMLIAVPILLAITTKYPATSIEFSDTETLQAKFTAGELLVQTGPNTVGSVADIGGPYQGLSWTFDLDTNLSTQATWTCKTGGYSNDACIGEQDPYSCCTAADEGYCTSLACGFGFNHRSDGDMGGLPTQLQLGYQNFVFENNIQKSGTVGYRNQFKTAMRIPKTSCTMSPHPDSSWTVGKYVQFKRAGSHVGYGIILDITGNDLTWASVGGGPIANGDVATEVDADGSDCGAACAANGTCTSLADEGETDEKLDWWTATPMYESDGMQIVLRGEGENVAGRNYQMLIYGPDMVLQCPTADLANRDSTTHFCEQVQFTDGIDIEDADGTDYCQITHASSSGSLDFDCTNTSQIESNAAFASVKRIVTTTGDSDTPSANEMLGAQHIADNVTGTNDTTYSLPALDSGGLPIGSNACFTDYDSGSGAIILNPDDNDRIIYNNVYLSPGEYLYSSGNAGDSICITGMNYTYWVVTSVVGTWSEETP